MIYVRTAFKNLVIDYIDLQIIFFYDFKYRKILKDIKQTKEEIANLP